MAEVEMCFWCMRPLDKSIQFDKEKDTAIFTSYKPCHECRELFSHGYQIIGVQNEQMMNGQIPITRDKNNNPLYPNGQMFLAPEEWVRAFLSEDKDKPMLEEVLKHKVMLLPREVIASIIADIQSNAPMVDEEMVEKQQNGKVVSNDIVVYPT